MQRATTKTRQPPDTQATTGLAFRYAQSLAMPPGMAGAGRPPPGYTVWPRAAWVRSLTPAATRSCTLGRPLRACIKASILANRSAAWTAKAFPKACSTYLGTWTPISLGSFKVSCRSRSTESGGIVPVMQRYRVAPMAYTSVQGPWLPWLEYCSSGA